MKMELEVELRDVPGQLSFVLDTVAEHGGNIESVIHKRGDARGEWVPVTVHLDIAPARSHRLVDALRQKVRVLEASGATMGHPMALILVGHVFDNKVDDFLNLLSDEGCRVHRVQAETSARENPSAVFVDVTGDSDEKLRAAVHKLEGLAAERGIAVLRSLPEVE